MEEQPTLRVAYQGEPGAYSEQASIDFFTASSPPSPPTYLPCPSFAAVFSALSSGAADRAVLPIENSLAGTIHAILDLFVAHPGLHIVGEHDFRVVHCLLAQPGARLEDVTIVRSHFMALAQCTGFLADHALTSHVAADTAGSAAKVANSGAPGDAAIASARAAKIYGLDILAEGIEDEKENYTRFLVLSRDAADTNDEYVAASAAATAAASTAASPAASEAGEKTNKPTLSHQNLMTGSFPTADLAPAKTSIVFTLFNKPGALFRALSVFSVLDIDLTKIESRHIHTVLDAVAGCDRSQARRWGYVFYVDFARSYAEEPVQNALKNLQQITPFYRLLGTYRRHEHEVPSSSRASADSASEGEDAIAAPRVEPESPPNEVAEPEAAGAHATNGVTTASPSKTVADSGRPPVETLLTVL